MYALVLSDNVFTSSFLSRGLKYENIQSAPFSFHNFNPNNLNMMDFDCAIIKIEEQMDEKLEPLSSVFEHFDQKPLYFITSSDLNIPSKGNNIIVTSENTSIRQIAYDIKKRINSSVSKPKENTIKIADLSLDVQRRVASRFDNKFNLRNKEFHLLEFLMRNPDIIFSRQKILEQVWDRNANMFTNTVDVHINILRKKIDNKDGSRLIETIHCNGYTMHSTPFA